MLGIICVRLQTTNPKEYDMQLLPRNQPSPTSKSENSLFEDIH
jgi:hypothetical protein